MENKELEYRMYFFVPYNISPIQQAIQAGHCVEEFSDQYFHTDLYQEYRKHKTWIILNGGTTNKKRDLDGIALGTLDQIGDSLLENKIPFAYFEEPDINDALTAVCFIGDERIWNYEDYPDFLDFVIKFFSGAFDAKDIIELRMMPFEDLKAKFPGIHNDWVNWLGGSKNVFLRELIKGKKKA